jgi:predicted DNA-binding transcriptional regulator AlpA
MRVFPYIEMRGCNHSGESRGEADPQASAQQKEVIMLGAFVTKEEVTKKFNISRVTLWRWENDGSLPKAFHIGSKRLYDTSQIEATIRKQAGQVS